MFLDRTGVAAQRFAGVVPSQVAGRAQAGRSARGAAPGLRVRVHAYRRIIAEAVATALEPVAGRPVIADRTDPWQTQRTRHRPDVVVVIGNRLDASTSAAVRSARRRWRQSIIIALADTDAEADGIALIRQGADAWLHPSEGLEALRDLVRKVASGERLLLAPPMMARITSSLSKPPLAQVAATSRLTSREAQVLECFARGLSREEISTVLGIGRATLRTHVQNILRKLDLHSMNQAAALLPREGEPGGDGTS
jgi:DNA-binding NarL/FixJ family response regulator